MRKEDVDNDGHKIKSELEAKVLGPNVDVISDRDDKTL